MAGYNAQLLSAFAGTNGGAIQGAIQGALAGQKKANAANEQRYQQGLGILQQGHTQAGGLLQSASDQIANNGQAGANRINLQEQNGLGSAAQSAVSRGLTNTTISDALNRGVSRDANDARLALQESVNNQQSQVKAQQAQEQLSGTGNIASFIANRNDTSPDLGLLASLVQGAASNPAGAMRSGSVTRNSVPGLGGSAMENGLPSSFGGGSGGGGAAGGYTMGADGASTPYGGYAGTSIPGVTPAAPSISSALSPAMKSAGSPGSITASLLSGPPDSSASSTPSQADQSAMWEKAIADAKQSVQNVPADNTPWMGSATAGYYTKDQWAKLSPDQQKRVLSGVKP